MSSFDVLESGILNACVNCEFSTRLRLIRTERCGTLRRLHITASFTNHNLFFKFFRQTALVIRFNLLVAWFAYFFLHFFFLLIKYTTVIKSLNDRFKFKLIRVLGNFRYYFFNIIYHRYFGLFIFYFGLSQLMRDLMQWLN